MQRNNNAGSKKWKKYLFFLKNYKHLSGNLRLGKKRDVIGYHGFSYLEQKIKKSSKGSSKKEVYKSLRMPELNFAFALQNEKTRTLGMKTTCAAIQVIFIEIILMAELPLPFKD